MILRALCLGLSLAACTTVQSTELIPDRVEVRIQHGALVRIEAEGSKRSYGVGARRIPGDDLAAAVRAAVLESGVFRGVTDGDAAAYTLHVGVESISDPEPSLDMVVAVGLSWRLTRPSDGTTVFESSIRTEAESRPDDALEFGHRGRIATERAVAKNIVEGLTRIGELEPAL